MPPLKETILISNRGNIYGRESDRENDPEYINVALGEGYDVRVDFWILSFGWFLGEEPRFHIKPDYLIRRSNFLWVCCMNLDALYDLMLYRSFINFFWNERNPTLTSKNHIWTQDEKYLTARSVIETDDVDKYRRSGCHGICSNTFVNPKALGKAQNKRKK